MSNSFYKKQPRIDFHYYVELDYDTNYDCINEGCDDICRCGTIENAVVENIDDFNGIRKLAEAIKEASEKEFKKISKLNRLDDNVLNYCFERIVLALKLYKSEKFEVTVEGGYYGQEIGNVYLLEDVEKKLMETVESFYLSLNPIEFILNLEYKFIPNYLRNRKWCLERIDIKNLFVSKSEYLEKVEKNNRHYDKNYRGVICVCIPAEGKYRLEDGYHRYASQENKLDNNDKNRMINVLVGYSNTQVEEPGRLESIE